MSADPRASVGCKPTGSAVAEEGGDNLRQVALLVLRCRTRGASAVGSHKARRHCLADGQEDAGDAHPGEGRPHPAVLRFYLHACPGLGGSWPASFAFFVSPIVMILSAIVTPAEFRAMSL